MQHLHFLLYGILKNSNLPFYFSYFQHFYFSEYVGERNDTYYKTLQFRHAALTRNKRLLLTYIYHRMKRMRKLRWELGSILPAEIKANLTNPEEQWFNSYNRSLATYMRSIGDKGLNIMKDMVPPKSLYIEVNIESFKKRSPFNK